MPLIKTLKDKVKSLPKSTTDAFKVCGNKDSIKGYHTIYTIKCRQCNSKRKISFESLTKTKPPICLVCAATKRKEEFVSKSINKFGNYLDYSKLKPIYNLDTKQILVCPIHGEFEAVLSNHLKGTIHPCRQCANDSLKIKYSDTTESFISKAKLLHKNKFNYSKVNYINTKTKVIVSCNKHGEWLAEPNAHLNGHGCPKCSHHISKPETKLVSWLKKKNITIELNRRDLLDGQREIDIYLPDYKIGIEVNGIFWHSEKFIENTYHADKSNVAFNNGIDLIHFWEHEINKKFSIVKSMIKHKLNLSNRYYARELICKGIEDKTTVNNFLDLNHLQGKCSYKIAYGLFIENKLYSVITLQKPRFNKNYDWELIRYATKLNTVIVGGASRLLYNFRKENAGTILSYADNRYSVGSVYDQLGFKYLGITKPNYFYVKGENVLSRYKCQKHKLKDLLNFFDPTKTELENMNANNWVRTFDAGHHIYVLV